MVLADLSPTLYPSALLFPWFAAAALCGALLIVETGLLFFAARRSKYRWRLLLGLASLGGALWAGFLASQDWTYKPNFAGIICPLCVVNYHGQTVSCCEMAVYMEKVQSVEPLTWLTVAATILLLALGVLVRARLRRQVGIIKRAQ